MTKAPAATLNDTARSVIIQEATRMAIEARSAREIDARNAREHNRTIDEILADFEKARNKLEKAWRNIG